MVFIVVAFKMLDVADMPADIPENAFAVLFNLFSLVGSPLRMSLEFASADVIVAVVAVAIFADDVARDAMFAFVTLSMSYR